MGGTETGKRPAEGDPRRGRGDKGRKLGGWTNRQQVDAEEVLGQGKIPERMMLGSFARKLEWGSAREGTQHTRTGRVILPDMGQTRH